MTGAKSKLRDPGEETSARGDVPVSNPLWGYHHGINGKVCEPLPSAC